MKKFLLLFLSFLVVFSLIACDDKIVNEENDRIVDESEPIDDNNENEDENDDVEEKEDLHQKITSIINTLTIEEKIGQLFIVGFTGKSIQNTLINSINKYHFGNFIYMDENIGTSEELKKLSFDIQSLVLNINKIPAFVAIDHEGGYVYRLGNNATHFLGNMAIAATNDPNNAYLVGKAAGRELKNYGINFNFAPVLDVNNNPHNPVIGIRSFSDNADVVASYGIRMLEGYKEANVLTSVKHFPGHGDTTTDSHYGLPKINYGKECLYEIELKPFIEAINSSVDAIMTAHIIFSTFDSELPATLSRKVLTNLLREELGYKGLIVTDEMRMQAITKYFEGGKAAVKAIQAGVDLLLYAESTQTSVEAYNSILNAYHNGEISEERINESVYRILEKKFKYGLFSNDTNESLNDFFNASKLNHDLIQESITIAKGKINFDKEKSTLIISTKASRYPLLPNYSINTNQNSLAYIGKEYFLKNGVKNVEGIVIDTNVSNLSNIINLAPNFEQILIAVENVSINQANLINQLAKINSNIYVIALRNPYDYLSYTNINNYICTYGYFEETVFAILDLFLGKYEAKGKLPVKIEGLN